MLTFAAVGVGVRTPGFSLLAGGFRFEGRARVKCSSAALPVRGTLYLRVSTEKQADHCS